MQYCRIIPAVILPTGQWQYFPLLQFLADNVAPRTTHSNIRKFDRPTDVPHSSKRSRKDQDSSSEKLAGAVIDYLKRPKDSSPPTPVETTPPPPPPKKSAGVLFGEMVADIYEEIPKGYHRDMMKMEVLKVMYDAKYRSQQQPSSSLLVVLPPQCADQEDRRSVRK